MMPHPAMRIDASIPRVPGVPLFGNLLDFREDRARLLVRIAREFGDIASVRIGFFTAVVVSAPELAHQVLVEHEDAFVKAPGLSIFARPLLGNGLLTSEKAFHRRQRRMMSPMFIHKRIAHYAEVMASRAESTASKWRDGETINVAAEMMALTLEIVGKTLFDAEVGEEAAEIGHALTAAMEHIVGSINSLVPIPPSWPTPANRRNRKAVARLDETIYRMIEERRGSAIERNDLLSMLLAARDEEEKSDAGSGMDDRQVRDEAMTLFLAGHETTANAMAWALYLLAQTSHVHARMTREIDEALGGRTPTIDDLPKLPYTLRVFKEAMRIYPPAYVVARLAERDVVIGGRTIKRGTVVMVNVIGMQRRASIFADPERFDPDRFAPEAEKALPRFAYLPFGAGPRVCIGNHFALMEGQLLLATIGQRVRLELPAGLRVEVEPLVVLRPRGGIPMRVRRRAGQG